MLNKEFFWCFVPVLLLWTTSLWSITYISELNFVSEIIVEIFCSFMKTAQDTPQLAGGSLCAGHGADLGGESPLRTVEIGTASLGQGVESDLGSEGS